MSDSADSNASTRETGVAVIGAGPVGLFAVFACGMLGMRCHVVDALDEPGGQCVALYPEKPIFDIPGIPEVSGGELIERLTAQARPFKPVFHMGQRVDGLFRDADGVFELITDGGTRLRARAVIIAGGVGAFGANRPPLDGIEAFENQGPGSGVKYAVDEVEAFRGRRVVIAGGGDSAVDWAVLLADVAAGVAVVHRRDRFRAAPASVSRLRGLAAATPAVELVVPYQLAGLDGMAGNLTGVRVRDLDGGERLLPADVLLAFFGLKQSLGPIAGWGLNLDRNRIRVTPNTAETSQPGIFAVGDIAIYDNKQKLILTGFSEASFAAHKAFALARPGEALHFEHSTHKGVPGVE